MNAPLDIIAISLLLKDLCASRVNYLHETGDLTDTQRCKIVQSCECAIRYRRVSVEAQIATQAEASVVQLTDNAQHTVMRDCQVQRMLQLLSSKCYSVSEICASIR